VPCDIELVTSRDNGVTWTAVEPDWFERCANEMNAAAEAAMQKRMDAARKARG
jgi:hypothetical protein